MEKINDAWVKGHPVELEAYFHEEMVTVHPRFTHEDEAGCYSVGQV